MEKEVVVVAVPPPSSAGINSENNSACSSPYITAPSSPQRFHNFFFSAPTSPSRISPSLSPQQHLSHNINAQYEDDDEDFEFNFSGQLDRTSLSADELFDGGKIRPLKPATTSISDSSLSSSSRSRSIQKRDLDESKNRQDHGQVNDTQPRGRDRMSSSGLNSSISSSSRKGISRSLSPMRVSDVISEQDDHPPSHSARIISSNASNSQNKSYASSILSAISFSKGYRKWKLKDLLLFRSASEGRPMIVDDSLKYGVLSKKETEEVKNSSFRSMDSSGSVRRVSAHELHYTANRAVAEEMKRKTFLPYKQGLLGCLGFNHGMHEISRGVGSMTRV